MMQGFVILVAVIIIWTVAARQLSYYFIRKGHKIWLSKTGGAIAGMVVALVCIIATQQIKTLQIVIAQTHAAAQSSSTVSTAQPNTIATGSASRKSGKTLGITPEIFAGRMNANLSAAGSSFRIKIHLDKGKVNDTFKYSFNDYLSIVGAVDKESKKLSSIHMLTDGDGTTQSGVDVITIVVSAYSAVLGENMMQTGEPAKIIFGLVEQKEKKIAEKKTVSTIFNNVKFGLMSSKYYGNWFTAEPI